MFFMIKYFRKEGENVINIAICEDNARILTSLKEMVNKLVKEEHNVFPFLNGNDLLNRIENFQEATIDIVITDIEMPLMDGHRLTKLIKDDDETKDIPVVIFSSLVNEEMRRKGEALGANAQLSKPEIGNLVREVDKLVLDK